MDDKGQISTSDLPGPTAQSAEQTTASTAEMFSQAGNVEISTESAPSTMTSSMSAPQQSSAWLTQSPTEATLPENPTEASTSTTTSEVSPTLQQRSQSPAATAPESSSVASLSVPSSEDTAVSLRSAKDDLHIPSETFPREFPSPAVAVSDSGNTASVTAFRSDALAVPTETVPRPAENDRSASAPVCCHNPIAAEVTCLDNTASEIASSLGATVTPPPPPSTAAAAAAAEAVSTVTVSAFVQHSTGSMESDDNIYLGWTLHQTGQLPPMGSIEGSGSRYPSESSPLTQETESPLTTRRLIPSMATSTQSSSPRVASGPSWSVPTVWQNHTDTTEAQERQTRLPELLGIGQEKHGDEGMPVTHSPEWESPAKGRAIMGHPYGNNVACKPSQRDESSFGQNPPSFSGDCNKVEPSCAGGQERQGEASNSAAATFYSADEASQNQPQGSQSFELPEDVLKSWENVALQLVQLNATTQAESATHYAAPQAQADLSGPPPAVGPRPLHPRLPGSVLSCPAFVRPYVPLSDSSRNLLDPLPQFSMSPRQTHPSFRPAFPSQPGSDPNQYGFPLSLTAPETFQQNKFGPLSLQQGTSGVQPLQQGTFGIQSCQPSTFASQPLQQGAFGSHFLQQGSFVSQPLQQGSFAFQPFQQGAFGSHFLQQGSFSSLQQGSLAFQPLQQSSFAFQPLQQGTFGFLQQGSFGSLQQGSFAYQPLQQGTFAYQPLQQGSFGSQPLQQGSFAYQPLQQGTFGSRPLQQDSLSSQTLQQGTFTSQQFEQGSLGFQPHQQGAFSFRPLQPHKTASVSIYQGENGSASLNSGVQAAPPSQSSGSWQSPRFPRSSQRSESFRKPRLHRLSTASEAPTKSNGAEESTAASIPKELQEVPSWDCDIVLVLKDAKRGSFKPGSKLPTADVHIARRYRLVPKWQSNLIVQNSFVEFSLKFLPPPRPQPYRVTGHTATAFQNPIPYFLVHPVVGTPQYDPDMQPLNWSDLVDGLRICITLPNATTMRIKPRQTNIGNNNNNCIMDYTFDQVGRYTINVLLRGQHVMGSPWVMHSCVKRTLKPEEVEDVFILHMNQLPNNRKLHGVCLDPHTERIYLPDRNTSSIFSYHLASDTVDNPRICPLDSNGVPMLLQPTDVSMSPDGQIYVCDKAGHRVRVLDRQGRVLGTYSGLQTTWGVSCASDGRVAIANFSSNRNGDLHIIDTDDGTICVLPLMFQNPRKPLFMPSGGLLLADFEKMALMEIYVDGITVRRRTRRYNMQSYGKPSGLAVDASGNVILSMGRSCTLVYFTAGGGDRTVYYDNPVIKDFRAKLPEGTSFGGVTVTKDGYIVVVLEDHDKTTRPPHRLLVIQPGVDTPQGRPLLGGKK